tara:strand:+ start:4693 stop:5493 length:801 start_codon:yes stop_codon:yes gene_type:complete
MAYPKITVNTGIVRTVIASDTIPIPSPSLPTLTGIGTMITTGENTVVLTDDLVDINNTFGITGTFSDPLPIQAGLDEVYNISTPTTPLATLITTLQSPNVLGLAADAFQNGIGERYVIIRPGHLINTATTGSFVTNGVSVGDVVVNNTTNLITRVSAVNNETDLTLEDDLFGNSVTFNDTYTIFLGGQLAGPEGKSSEGCLLYVSTPTIENSTPGNYVASIKVKTVAGDDVTFLNFPVGHYLPVQITQLFSTDTTVGSRTACRAIW